MWKWIGIILLAIIILVIGVVYMGYRKLQEFASDTSPVSVVIAAPVDRVFGVLADGDSLGTWFTTSQQPRLRHPGPLQKGDTITIEVRNPRDSTMRETLITVGEVKGLASLEL